ncbi:hypothetical protein [Breznakiella homolactica]|uniref:MxaA protein n=1 Tax=Breznakiella homolactica TaxID=2798577 RepID=A0A7T7XMG7_9SPIR|nr:hypothetical protein [Breznakiella homolactica]QQO08953.1 hypothetical protein JFL75_18785 [Breznakiella homolactica]
MKRMGIAVFWGLLILHPLFCQQASGNGSSTVPYLIPQTVFVGDRARLVVPLGSAFSGTEGMVRDIPSELPRARDVEILRVELERRGGAARLLVDFQAYIPGVVELPLIELGTHEFTGLRVHITSILGGDGDSRILSPAASGASVPGTMAVIYGSIAALIFLAIAVIAVMAWGIPRLGSFQYNMRRAQTVRSLRKTLKKLGEELNKASFSGEAAEKILASLSGEFRRYLSFFAGVNCCSMVPGEFLYLQPGAENGETRYLLREKAFLHDFFRRSDAYRFGGGAGPADIRAMLEAVREFSAGLEQPGPDTETGAVSGNPAYKEGAR